MQDKIKKITLISLLISVLLVAGCVETSISDDQGSSNLKQTEEAPPAPPQDDDDQLHALPNDEGTTDQKASADQTVLQVQSVSNDEIPPIPIDSETTTSSNPKEFVGLWSAFSSRLFYDAGGGGALGSGTGYPMEINADGTWKYSSSAGKWHVEDVTSADWTKWKISDYGPKRKMVLDGWNNGIADGPVEESSGRVDFFWSIYRVGPPKVGVPGLVNVKYGHTN